MVMVPGKIESIHVEYVIRRLLERRHAVALNELCLWTGADKAVVRSQLESMVKRGDVERLRPIGYGSEDRDFYRPVRPVVRRPEDGRRRLSWEDGRDHVRLAGLAMASLPE